MAPQAADWPILLAGTLFCYTRTSSSFSWPVSSWQCATSGGAGPAVAYMAEYASIRIGIPSGLYHDTGESA